MTSYILYIMYAVVLVLILAAGYLNILDKSTASEMFIVVVSTLLGVHVVPPFLQKNISLTDTTIDKKSPLVQTEEIKT